MIDRSKRYTDRSSRWLALILFLVAMYLVPWMLGHQGWYAKDGYREFLFFVPFQQFYLLGPAIYFYITSLLHQESKFKKKDLLHFFPAIGYALYSLVIFVGDVFIFDEFYFYADGEDKDLDTWYQLSGLAFILFYAWKSYQVYQAYRRHVVEMVSYADELRFSWIKQFLFVLLIVVFLRLIFFILFPEFGSFGQKWWYYLLIAIIFYYVSIVGFSHIEKLTATLAFKMPEVIEVDHSGSAIDEKELIEFKAKVEHFLGSERGYKNPQLSLMEVASSLGTTPKKISQVSNQGFNSNFNDLINKKRVNAFIEMIDEGRHDQFTLLSLALDCGFNSKTTFNRSFKKVTGKTPQQYLAAREK